MVPRPRSAALRARLRLVRRLGLGGVVSVLAVWWRLVRVSRSLRRHGLRVTLARIGVTDLLSSSSDNDRSARPLPFDSYGRAPEVARVVQAVRLAAPRAGARCLPQAIVLAGELRRMGLDAGIRIGAALGEPITGPVTGRVAAGTTGAAGRTVAAGGTVAAGRTEAAETTGAAGAIEVTGRKPQTLRAHAWVELAGEPVGEDPGEYEAFDGAALERVLLQLAKSPAGAASAG